ncbi:MAG: 8-oxo-dGTP diphosphatase [Propionibacteriaceae bacterium]|jgi:8-oxo-dGTP diphosphatase|nr:8-oxo-dGTP diphosphatase [Propionibacteriaceae bacterium]
MNATEMNDQVHSHEPKRRYRPVLGVLGYAIDPEAGTVLLIHRNRRPEDFHRGKYNGLGGKVEAGENIFAAMRREFFEESGLTATRLRLKGTISWPGFGVDANGEAEDWFGFIFLIDAWEGTLRPQSDEGETGWIDLGRLARLELPLWPGDRHFLPLLLDDGVAEFHGVMPYVDGQPASWDVEIVPA